MSVHTCNYFIIIYYFFFGYKFLCHFVTFMLKCTIVSLFTYSNRWSGKAGWSSCATTNSSHDRNRCRNSCCNGCYSEWCGLRNRRGIIRWWWHWWCWRRVGESRFSGRIELCPFMFHLYSTSAFSRNEKETR